MFRIEAIFMCRPVKGLLIAAVAGLSATAPRAAFEADNAAPQEIWLSGVDPVVLHDRDNNAADNDFMELFKPGASWPGARHVQVFKVSTQFLHRSSDEQLTTVVQYLRSHHIALALEAEIMVTSVRCGNGNPGFTTAAVIHKAADRVRSVGGQIDDVAFDEPMAFGRVHRRPGQCGFSIEELVQNIAPNIRTFKEAFPGVVFGDIEPVSDATLNTPGCLDDMLEFARVFQQQTGEKLAFLQADIIWQNRWQPTMSERASRSRASSMAVGRSCQCRDFPSWRPSTSRLWISPGFPGRSTSNPIAPSS